MPGEMGKRLRMFFQTRLEYSSQRRGRTFVTGLVESEVFVDGGKVYKTWEKHFLLFEVWIEKKLFCFS